MTNRPETNDYYKARIEAERNAAAAATCPQAKRAHEEMALAYEKLSGKAEVGISRPHIRSSKIR